MKESNTRVPTFAQFDKVACKNAINEEDDISEDSMTLGEHLKRILDLGK